MRHVIKKATERKVIRTGQRPRKEGEKCGDRKYKYNYEMEKKRAIHEREKTCEGRQRRKKIKLRNTR